jgi:hypothetical protein
MKKLLLFISLLAFVATGYAQKEDVNWVSGYSSIPLASNDSSAFGLITINFLNNVLIQKKIGGQPFRLYDNNTCISDKNGNLLMYYNGNDIYNSLHQKMKGSDSLNFTKPIHFLKTPQEFVPQGGLILPYPNHENQYMLIHQQVEYLIIQDSVADIRGERLYYSVIDMNKENGLGEVIERKKLILADSMEYGKLSACRHANGKDWSIMVQVNSTPTYYKILLNEEGIKIYDKQTIGNDNYYSLGYAIFSPDGKSYVNFDPVGYNLDCAIMNFDRCTGNLSNFKSIKSGIPIEEIFAGGTAISPNSRFLYFILDSYIFQYDLWATDLAESKVLIAKYDNFLDDNNLPTRFFMGQLAPNGKIYISSTSGTRYLTVINKPDLKGDSCEIVQHGFKLLTGNSFGLPNLPNFRLGKADTPCEMVSTAEVEKVEVKIYPNPATSEINILYNPEKLQYSTLIISDIQGKTVLQKALDDDKIDVSDFPNGIYFLQILNENKVVFREKVVILK